MIQLTLKQMWNKLLNMAKEKKTHPALLPLQDCYNFN